MKRGLLLLVSAAFLLGAALVTPAAARVDVDVDINLVPPVITFDHEPHLVLVPRSRVYYAPGVSDYDMYRYGGDWYVNRGGQWYRSPRYDGPFEIIEYGSVPQPIYVVPRTYRHHWDPGHGDWDHHRDWDHHHGGRGHGKHHGRHHD